MRTADVGAWIARLEAEIGQELGQPVAMRVGGSLPESSSGLIHTLDVPGARITIAVAGDDLALFMAEARLIEAGQADSAMVAELWAGILTSMATRLGGTAHPVESCASASMESCVLQLGSATTRVGLTLEVEERAARPEPAGGKYDLLLEVELDALVRFGSRELDLGEILELGPGDVVELDRQVSDPVDLIVGDKIVARGEVVLVNGNFGLRVTEIAEPSRRLESVRCFC